MTTSFYSEDELLSIGFKKLGKNVRISRKTSIYGASNMEIGDNVRIDDFCILSGKIKIGNYVHIASGCYLFAGNGGIILEDFSGLSSKVTIYAVTDDYSGCFLTNPTIPEEFRNVIEKQVLIKKHAIVGTGATILPGVTLGIGVAVGAMSLVTKDVPDWAIVAGIPAKFIKERDRKLLEMEKQLLEKYGSNNV